MSEKNISERRRQTRNRVYRCIYDSPSPLSKQELSQMLNLSLPTVYQNISELLELGLIEYTGTQESAGGRPAMLMRAVAGARYAIGVLMTEDRLHFTSTDLRCGVLAKQEVSHSLSLLSAEYNAFFRSALEAFISANHIDRDKLLGVGICLAGIVLEDNTVFYAPTLGLRNVSMQPLADALPYPVRFFNDACSGGFAEWFSGSTGSECLAYLSLSYGVGGAVFVNGDAYSGRNMRSGEFGHMCVEPGGLNCTCGKKGCLEAYCSAARISTDLGMSIEEFFRRIEDGSRRAAELWEDYLRHLAIGVHNIRMALDCSVVLGGMMAEFLLPYMPRLRQFVAQCDPFSSDTEYLRICRFSGKGSILGAALYFVKDFLENNI